MNPGETTGQEYAQLQQGFPSNPPSSAPPGDQQPRLVFNQEELRVLRECRIESFYYRCVPMAAALSAAAFVAMKRGVLKVSERYGYTPKMLGAAALGYFAGKFSYQNTCAEKLMRLPDSPVGEALRKRKGRLGFQESLNIEPGFSVDLPSADSSPTHPRQPEMYEQQRPDFHNEGLEEYERGVTESLNPYAEVLPGSSQQHTTYEELRRQNREEYLNRMAEKYRRPVSELPPDSTLQNQPPEDFHAPPPAQMKPQSPPQRVARKNQYGDEIHE